MPFVFKNNLNIVLWFTSLIGLRSFHVGETLVFFVIKKTYLTLVINTVQCIFK